MDPAAATEDLYRAREETLAQIGALTREFDSVVAASEAANADDEHDPEGATMAFERQQLAALLDSARSRLADVDAALARAAAGDYGRCAECGREIDPERLAAPPQAPTSVHSAAAARRVPPP